MDHLEKKTASATSILQFKWVMFRKYTWIKDEYTFVNRKNLWYICKFGHLCGGEDVAADPSASSDDCHVFTGDYSSKEGENGKHNLP